jgi:integrase
MTTVRRRQSNRHLPPCVYVKHGAYWLVKKGKWTRLGDDLPTALSAYANHAKTPVQGMPALIERWLEDVTPTIKPATQTLYKQAATRLAEVFREFEPAQVTAQDVDRWMLAEAYRPSWANRMRDVLKLIMDKAILMGLTQANPVTVVKRHKVADRTRYITDAEYQAISNNTTPVLKIVMGLCYHTGQRISDILGIRLADLTDDGITFTQQKTGARLTVEWTPELLKLKDDAKGMGGNVRGMHLLCYNGRPWAYRTIYKQWRAACKAAGVDNAHIHDLRAKSLTDANRQGLDAQALAGHTNRKMTDHYVKQRTIPLVKSPKFGTKY